MPVDPKVYCETDANGAAERPVCFIGQDQISPLGELLEGGWHYSVVVDEEAKKIAVEHAQAHVALWENRAKKPGLKALDFVQGRLASAKDSLEAVESASFEVPDRKLSLDSETGVYTFAEPGDESWQDKHHERLAIIAPGGNIGYPHDAESVEATRRHLMEKLERIATDGLHQHEIDDDHVLTNPVEISAATKWLDTLPAAKGGSR